MKFRTLLVLFIVTAIVEGCGSPPNPAWQQEEAARARANAVEWQRQQRITAEIGQASQQVMADLEGFYSRGLSSVQAAYRAHSAYEQERVRCMRDNNKADYCWRKEQAFNQIELTWMDQRQRAGEPLYGFATCTLQSGCTDRSILPAIFQSPEACAKLNINAMETVEATYCFVRPGPGRPWKIISAQRGRLMRVPAQWGVE